MMLDQMQNNFIGNLRHLAEKGREDRGALADLRSGLGREPGQMSRVHKYVVPYLPEKNFNDRWYYVVASLFGLFHEHRNGLSIGAALRPLRVNSESTEARFVALLNAHAEDLDEHLRHVVSLLKANNQPFDWYYLLRDLLQWDHPDGYIQLRWARDFYKNESSESVSENNK